ncbi:MAG TPA: TIGR00730 family Rossman fold protein [Burkholderiaceae bacterium]|nr:TIGR00730 family Rossman fold protein [Burkholderiaceae bacterium]
MTTPTFSICVYCGSRHGARACYTSSAREIGRLVGERGWRLVYGGGKVGLMGEVADSALASGAEVVGVIPDSLMRREVGHAGLTELHVVPSMHQRKHMMAERADAFIALPGGIGTFEELFEVWTWAQLGYHDQPIGLLNIEGYYDRLLQFLQHTVDEGFLAAQQFERLRVDSDPTRLLDRLAADARDATAAEDFTRI